MSENDPPSVDEQPMDQPNEAEQSEEATGKPQVVQHVDHAQLQHFVTEIKSSEQQVGEHVIRALHHDGTVAVLTTVVLGPDGRQQVVSAALDPKMMRVVQSALADAEAEREHEEPCVGFHCLIKPKGAASGSENDGDSE